MNDDEIAFYDALTTNKSAVDFMGDETLKKIAQELYYTIYINILYIIGKIEWTQKNLIIVLLTMI
jgi:type I restriction enzyme R subunit